MTRIRRGTLKGMWPFAATAMTASPVPFEALSAGSCPPQYTVQIMEGPTDCQGGFESPIQAWGLNDETLVCGFYFLCGLGNGTSFTSDGNILSVLPMPPNTSYSLAGAISNSGMVIGDISISGDGLGMIGFYHLNGQTMTIPPLAGGSTVEVHAINSSNVVCGAWGHVGTGPFPQAFRWENGVMQNLHEDLVGADSRAYDVNDANVITGWMNQTMYPPDHHAFIWENGKVTDLGLPFPEAIASEGRALSDNGMLVGWWYHLADSPTGYAIRGFVFDGNRFVDLPTLSNAPLIEPYDVNDSGVIVGFVGHFGGGWGTVWHDGVPYRLHDLIDRPDLVIDGATAINEQGQITAVGRDTSFHDLAFLLTPQQAVAGDTNCDHVVNVDDLLAVINEWGVCVPQFCAADVNVDGIVNAFDILVVLNNWG